MRLRRLLALLVVGLLVPLVAFSAVAVYTHGREETAATERALLDAARALVAALDKHFEATITALEVLGTSAHLDAGDLRAFHAQCVRALVARDEWRAISLFDLTGQRLLVTAEPYGVAPPRGPASMAAPFRRLVETRRPDVSDLFKAPVTGLDSVSVGVPIVREGHTRWVISAGMAADAVGKLLAGQHVLPESTGAFFDRRHAVVAQSLGRAGIGEPPAPTLAMAGGSAGEGTLRRRGRDGAATVTAFSRSGQFGWMASIEVAAPMGLFGTPVRAILVAGAALLMASIGLAVWAGRRISRPIEALAVAAERIGRGEPAEPVASGVTEVAALSTALVGAGRARADADAALARYAERLRILHEIDRALIAAESPKDIAEAALRRLRPLLGVRRAVVALFDLKAGEEEWLAVDAPGATALGPGARYPLSMVGDLEALQRGEVQVIDDMAALGHFPQAQMLLAEGIRSYVVVPLVVGGELVGSLSFGSGAAGRLPEEQLGTTQEVATQLAIAIAQARLHERVRHHAEEMELRVRERTLELGAANAQLEEEIALRERARAEADRANHAKSDFLSGMSHELRTPLNGILGFAQLLEMESPNPEHREAVGHILKGGRHLLELINEVLDLARIETGRLHVSLEPVSVKDALRAAADLMRPMAVEARIALTVSGDARQHVLGDRQRLQQVFLNLLSNAVKYNRPGGAVTVWCEESGDDRVRIRVADTGGGMTSEQLEGLFVPFERLGAEGSGIEGAGLGLALSRRLVEAMGGRLGVESVRGEGSTFSVEMPLTSDPGLDVGLSGSTEAAAPGASEVASLVVLYIEDNVANMRLVERVMALRPRVELLSAMRGQPGLDLARERCPGLILLDQHLPDMPGDEVLRRLQSDARTRAIPVVVLSADASPDRIQRMLEAGARDYLTKPLEIAKLLALVDALAL